MRSRLAIVVQRCGEGIVGGSEDLAWQWAKLLSTAYDVELLTTTARDAVTWENSLPEGDEVRDGVTVRRFSVDIGRTAYWHGLHERLLTSVETDKSSVIGGTRWTTAWQEEFIRKQGPYSSGLIRYVHGNANAYETIIYVTHLFPTTYFGWQQTPGIPRILVATLHDEAAAYLPAYRMMAGEADSILWNTNAERRLGERLWGAVPGRVVGMAVETGLRFSAQPLDGSLPYLLYCGRLDTHKGCDELLDWFYRFSKRHPGMVRLILTGHDETGHSFGPGVEFRGYVAEEEKLSLMRNAAVYCMPSRYESFSISSLEAMAQETPVLATAVSDVLSEHVRESGAGMLYGSYEEFDAAVLQLISNSDFRRRMGSRGRAYVVDRYSREAIQAKLIAAVRSVTDKQSGGA